MHLKFFHTFKCVCPNQDSLCSNTCKNVNWSQCCDALIVFNHTNVRMYFPYCSRLLSVYTAKMPSNNFALYCKIDDCDLPKPRAGMFKHVRETKNLRSAMGFYYNFFFSRKSSRRSDVVWSVPYYDVGGLGMVTTAASAVIVQGKLISRSFKFL